jgi:hypothetical protein
LLSEKAMEVGGKTISLVYGGHRDNFVFILCPKMRPERFPKYKVVESSEGSIFIPITLTRCEEPLLQTIDEHVKLEQLVATYRGRSTQKVQKAKRLTKFKLVVEEEPAIVLEGVPAKRSSAPTTARRRPRLVKNNATAKKRLVIDESPPPEFPPGDF